MKFKEPQRWREFLSARLNPEIRQITLLLARWLLGRYGIDLVITSVLCDDPVSRKEGREADVWVRDWPVGAAIEAEEWIKNHLKTFVIKINGDPTSAAVRHDLGKGGHIHLYTARGGALETVIPHNETMVI